MKAIKKIMVAVLLSLSMVVSFVPMNVFAVEAVDIWDGTADTSWYVGHEVDSEYHITTAEQLAGLAQLVNGNILFKDKNDDLIQKRLRTLITGLASAGLEAKQVSNDDLRIILDNFLNSGMTTNFGTVIA